MGINVELKKFALISEIVSAIAVVISLIFVGYQISQNTDEVRASNRQQVTLAAISATQLIAGNTELAAIFSKIENNEELTNAENIQYSYFVRSLLYDIQNAYLLHLEGRLEDSYWATRAVLLKTYLDRPASRSIIERDKDLGNLDERFVLWLNAEMD